MAEVFSDNEVIIAAFALPKLGHDEDCDETNVNNYS